MFAILTDATSDMPKEALERYEIQIIPMEFSVGGSTYLHYSDGRNLGFHEYYERIRSGEPSTTMQITPQMYMDEFEGHLKAGRDVLYIAFSSGMSGSFNSSRTAAAELEEKYPERKIYTVDSLCASCGEGLLVYTAAQKRAEGLSIDEVKAWTEGKLLSLHHLFTVDDLNHLKRGGRISPTMAFAGTLLGIKPILKIDEFGKIVSSDKVRSRQKSLQELVSRMEKRVREPEGQTIFIGHGDCVEDAEYVRRLVLDKFNVKEVLIGYIGPVVGAHSGPGTVALFFYGEAGRS